MERERCNSIANGDYSYSANGIYSKICNDYSVLEKERDQSSPDLSLRGNGYIEHPVSRFDTMAGVAIKYGVETKQCEPNASPTFASRFARFVPVVENDSSKDLSCNDFIARFLCP